MKLSEYWAIMWREGDDWGWLRSLDGNEECTTREGWRRKRYASRENAMAALWLFRARNPKRPNEHLRLVHVVVRAKERL